MVWVSVEDISVGKYVDSFGSIRVRKQEWDDVKSKWKKNCICEKKKFKMLTLYKKKVEMQDEKGLVMCLNEIGRDWS